MLAGVFGFFVAACAGGNSPSGGDDASTGPILSGSPDSGSFVFVDDAGEDAGPLLSPCNPSNPSSCPTGFVCYAQHTSATWWVDLYGTCTFDCNSQTYPLCDSLGGVCGCPVPRGGHEQELRGRRGRLDGVRAGREAWDLPRRERGGRRMWVAGLRRRTRGRSRGGPGTG